MNDLPSETWHGLKYIDFGPDDNLYIPVGVPCNICIEPQTKDNRFAAIHKYVDGELITVELEELNIDFPTMKINTNGREIVDEPKVMADLTVIENNTQSNFENLNLVETKRIFWL